MEDNPSYLTYGGEGDSAVYSEGVFVGYRYYDRKKMGVLFPFGYGLSYTKFEYNNLVLSKENMTDTEEVTVSVDVTNTGNVAGKEVVQLYVSDLESTCFRPVRELKEFAKVFLNPGETKKVTFILGKRAFAYWNTAIHDWHVETGAFSVQICASSREVILEKQITVTSTVHVPEKYTVDSIFMDLLVDPNAVKVLKPIMDGFAVSFGSTGGGEDSAISNEVMQAMIKYMPLRSIASFSGGAISLDQLTGLVAMINQLNGIA